MGGRTFSRCGGIRVNSRPREPARPGATPLPGGYNGFSMRHFLLNLFAVCVTSANAYGWGCEGHQIVALIARAHLHPSAVAAVDQLLNDNPIDPALNRFCKDRPSDSMADASTWADDVRNIERTGLWHYVDIPLTVSGRTSLAPWCPAIRTSVDGKDRPGCITNAIQFEWGVLKDGARPPAERAKALRYIIHFVGDIHQPLHDSDNDDRGGNCTSIKFFEEERLANLHAIWDYKLIERDIAGRKLSIPDYAAVLDSQMADRWKNQSAFQPDPEIWVWEGNALAKSLTYGALKPLIPIEQPNAQADCDVERDKVAALHIEVSDDYFHRTIPVVDEQLAKAGYRLAELLNETFR